MTPSKLSISVAMCTYNGSAFLPEQLASIAAQARLPDEIVICDDGSTDSTPQIVEEFASSVSFPVRWVRNEVNLGSTKNFEKVIGLCTGDLIALSDQDDIWLPEKLARQGEMFERDPELGGVFSDADLVDHKSQSLGKRLWASILFTRAEQSQLSRGRGLSVLLKKNVVTGATCMVRANQRTLFMPIPDMWIHDGWIAWMMTLFSKLRLIEDPLIWYRIHANQQAGVRSLTKGRKLSRRTRLRNARSEEPRRLLETARELERVELKILESNRQHAPGALAELRRRICFLLGRARPSRNRLLRTGWILRNTSNYKRYEQGLRDQLWDIAKLLV